MSKADWPHEALVEMAGAVDLRGNSITTDVGDGHVRVEPVDPSKKFYADGEYLVDNLTREQLVEVLNRRRALLRKAEPV